MLVQLCETLRRSEDDDHATLHRPVAQVNGRFSTAKMLVPSGVSSMYSAVARVVYLFLLAYYCW